MCDAVFKGFCEGRDRFYAVGCSPETDVLSRLGVLRDALAEAQTLIGWDSAAVLTADCGSRSIQIHVKGEVLGRELSARLLPAVLCHTERTSTAVGYTARQFDRITHFHDWYGVYAGHALNVTASWETPVVERDLSPQELAAGVRAGWADLESDPTEIDWAARQERALIPFTTNRGRPCIPGPSTGIHRGRNQMGRWGESAMADALVTADLGDGARWLLLVERADGNGWAVPGGKIEVGETPVQAAARELGEETGLILPAEALTPSPARLVPDPRASDEAWAVTVVARAHLYLDEVQHLISGGVPDLPAVVGSDDARRAEWVQADTYADLVTSLRDRFKGNVFPAHIEFLSAALAEAS
jgi:ADP-ribose pyrophosphatase